MKLILFYSYLYFTVLYITAQIRFKI